MPRNLSSLDVYKRLIAIADELSDMEKQCWSPGGERVLHAAARVIRGAASAFWLLLKPDESQGPEQYEYPDRRQQPPRF